MEKDQNDKDAKLRGRKLVRLDGKKKAKEK